MENDEPILRQVHARTPEEIQELAKQRKAQGTKAKERTLESQIESKVRAITKLLEKGEFYDISDPVEKAELEELGIYQRVHKILIEQSVKWQFINDMNRAFGDDEDGDFTVSFGKKAGF